MERQHTNIEANCMYKLLVTSPKKVHSSSRMPPSWALFISRSQKKHYSEYCTSKILGNLREGGGANTDSSLNDGPTRRTIFHTLPLVKLVAFCAQHLVCAGKEDDGYLIGQAHDTLPLSLYLFRFQEIQGPGDEKAVILLSCLFRFQKIQGPGDEKAVVLLSSIATIRTPFERRNLGRVCPLSQSHNLLCKLPDIVFVSLQIGFCFHFHLVLL